MAVATPCCAFGKACSMMTCPVASSPPPPSPWTTRQKISPGRDVERPHINEASVKTMMEAAKYCRRPNRSESQPVVGSTITLEMM